MIKIHTKGSILDADVEALVNAVNCVGVMGRGLALQFKKKFPDNFAAYKELCDASRLLPGSMFVFDMGSLRPRYIINFPTKGHWRADSKIEDIAAGLNALVDEVRPLVIQAFEPVKDIQVALYAPQDHAGHTGDHIGRVV